MNDEHEYEIPVEDDAPKLTAITGGNSPAPAATAGDTKVVARIRAYFGDLVTKNCAPMSQDWWVRQGLSKKEAQLRPVATVVTYTNTKAKRALFERRERIADGRKIREMDGVWLTVNYDGKPLPAASPLVLSRGQAAIEAQETTLYITDREDVVFALTASGAAVIGVTPGSSLFANEEIVDSRTPELPRTLHPGCVAPLGARDVVFIYEDRDAALRAARGLRQGGAHTGRVYHAETSLVLAEIDSAIAQGLTGEALYKHTLIAPSETQLEITVTVTSGHPGSIGARVPPHLLDALPSPVKDLMWPVPEGGGTSWENLDWALSKGGAVMGVFRDQKGEELTLNKPAMALRTPVYITRRLSAANQLEEQHSLEVQWTEATPAGFRVEKRILPATELIPSVSKAAINAGVPVADGRRAGQWFNAFLAANPKLPEAKLHTQAGWVVLPDGKMHWLMPETGTELHEIQSGVLSGIGKEGSAELQWQLLRDLHAALAPINAILLTVPHASILLSALQMPGCVFGLVDDTSKGKSVLLETTARQYGWGGADYGIDASVPPTAAYLERCVQRANGLCNFIDEFHKLANSPKELQNKNGLTRQEAAYFLSNGQRKGRSNAHGGIDATIKRIYSYSIVAGEAKHITQLDRMAQMEGARVRMITLPLIDYSAAFLAKYESLAGFMHHVHRCKGHVGEEVSRVLATYINTLGIPRMLQDIADIAAQLTEQFRIRGATSNVSIRRVHMLAAEVYTEMLLGKHFGAKGIWSADFENTDVMKILRSEHANLLMLTDSVTEEKDGLSIAEILLEELRRDPTRVQGLISDEKANTRPLGRLQRHKRSEHQGIHLFPKAVFELLKRHGISETAAREVMAKSGEFVLQTHRTGTPTLLHKSNGEQWLIPYAGWGWDLMYGAYGDEDARLKDPYMEQREAFEKVFEQSLQQGLGQVAALQQAFHDFGTNLRASKAASVGSLKERLGAKDVRAWAALVRPLVDRLLDKPGTDPSIEEWEGILQTSY